VKFKLQHSALHMQTTPTSWGSHMVLDCGVANQSHMTARPTGNSHAIHQVKRQRSSLAPAGKQTSHQVSPTSELNAALPRMARHSETCQSTPQIWPNICFAYAAISYGSARSSSRSLRSDGDRTRSTIRDGGLPCSAPMDRSQLNS
jgi:hypothetical protein